MKHLLMGAVADQSDTLWIRDGIIRIADYEYDHGVCPAEKARVANGIRMTFGHKRRRHGSTVLFTVDDSGDALCQALSDSK